VASLADPLSESPLESLVRLALHESEFPAPELQVEVSVAGGQRSYRVDFMWRASRLILEADGRIKYNTSELWDEKRREMELTRAGFRVERVVWADLGPNWKIVAARLRHLLSLTPTT
jgi:very-short-patch-repair endonuclease